MLPAVYCKENNKYKRFKQAVSMVTPWSHKLWSRLQLASIVSTVGRVGI